MIRPTFSQLESLVRLEGSCGFLWCLLFESSHMCAEKCGYGGGRIAIPLNSATNAKNPEKDYFS